MSITSPAQSRHQLPQLADQVFLADGGIETTLIYHQGINLPEFAAFVLLEDERGREELRRYFRPYAEIAADAGLGLVLETRDLARQPGLGQRTRLHPRYGRGRQPSRRRAGRGVPPRLRGAGRTRRDQRLHRTAR